VKDVSIQVDALGIGKLVVGGVDISDRVTGVYVRIEPGHLSTVEIEVTGDVVLDVKQADVTVSRTA